MDNIKIGKYIAEKRKELGLTQKQLAEKLNMSDKSVSKWERGICFPDVSVYAELCQILGISINELLAGEDIPHENILQKSEENIIGVATDGKRKQKRLKIIIVGLLIISIVVFSAFGISFYRESKPQNVIATLDHDSVERQTIELLAGPEGAHVYKFVTTDEYQSLRIYISEYHSGELVNKERKEIGFHSIGSPENGEILIVPDFENFKIKIVMAADGCKLSSEIPILDGVPDKKYYGRSATEIQGNTDIRYNQEHPLVAFVYDNDEMRVPDISCFSEDPSDSLGENDYVYYFSYEFCK